MNKVRDRMNKVRDKINIYSRVYFFQRTCEIGKDPKGICKIRTEGVEGVIFTHHRLGTQKGSIPL